MGQSGDAPGKSANTRHEPTPGGCTDPWARQVCGTKSANVAIEPQSGAGGVRKKIRSTAERAETTEKTRPYGVAIGTTPVRNGFSACRRSSSRSEPGFLPCIRQSDCPASASRSGRSVAHRCGRRSTQPHACRADDDVAPWSDRQRCSAFRFGAAGCLLSGRNRHEIATPAGDFPERGLHERHDQRRR